jgi:uncharacterized protein (TIGR02594 family)
MTPLPANYQWLNKVNGLPKELQEALTHYGLLEHKGAGNNPDIMAWAKEVGVSGWYSGDDVPWCGLFKGVCAKRASWIGSKPDLLAAKSWLKWGVMVTAGNELLGDTLIFGRDGGGHVGYYIGEDSTHFYVFGGNQSDAVTFSRIAKDRLLGCRRAPFKIAPAGVKKVYLNIAGTPVTSNEA